MSHNAGIRNGNAKLSCDDVREIITTTAYRDDVGYQPGSVKMLAERFGVTRDTIRQIARGLRWKGERASAEGGPARRGHSKRAELVR
jgi:hypothetical protein